MFCQGMNISIEDVDPLTVCRARPVHMGDNISWEPDLLDPRYPLVDVGDDRKKELAVGPDNFVQVRKVGIINLMAPRCAVPRSSYIGTLEPVHLCLNSSADGYRPPVGPYLSA